MSTRKNIVANYLGQGLTGVLSLAFVPVYIRYIGIEAYGLIGLFAVMQVWLTLLDVGMSPTLSREMARFSAGSVSPRQIRDLLHSVTLLCFGIAAVIIGGVAAASGFLAESWLNVRTLSQDTVAHAFLIMAVVIGLRFAEGVQRSALIGLQRQVWLNVLTVVMALFRSVGAVVVLAFVSATIEAYMVWQGAISLLTLVALMIKVRAALPKGAESARFSPQAIREVSRFAGGMLGISLLAILLTQVDKLLLSSLLPLDQFGYYMLASNVAGMIFLVVAPVTQALYPHFVQLAESNRTQALAESYHQASQLISVLLGPAALVLVLFPHSALLAWSGDPALADRTAPLLAMLTVGTFVNALLHVPHQLQLAHGWTQLSLRFNAVAVALLVPLLLVLVPRYGAIASAVIFTGLNIAYVVLLMPLMHRGVLPGELTRWYARDVGLPLLGAGLVALVARALAGDLPHDRWTALALVVLTGATASAVAIVCAPAMRRSALGIVEAVAKRRA